MQEELMSGAQSLSSQHYCGYHQGYVDATAGAMIARRNRKIWMCDNCMKFRKIPSPVKAKQQAASRNAISHAKNSPT